jgi:hypothetical protein
VQSAVVTKLFPHWTQLQRAPSKIDFFMTDGSEMPWAERQRNAFVPMNEVLNLKNQTVSRHSLQIQTALRHSLKKTVLGQRVNPKLLEKPWAGGTLFFQRFRCYLKQSQGTFRAVFTKLQQNKKGNNFPVC